MTRYYVDIIRYSDNETVKTLEARNERDAERLDRGVNTNLNHEEFYTQTRKD